MKPTRDQRGIVPGAQILNGSSVVLTWGAAAYQWRRAAIEPAKATIPDSSNSDQNAATGTGVGGAGRPTLNTSRNVSFAGLGSVSVKVRTRQVMGIC